MYLHCFFMLLPVKPEIYFLPPEVQLPPNADLTLTCAIQAYPLTEAYWIDNDGRRVESSWRYSLITTTDEYYRMTFVSIVFINRGDEIFGTYTCHAIGMEVVTKSVDVISTYYYYYYYYYYFKCY